MASFNGPPSDKKKQVVDWNSVPEFPWNFVLFRSIVSARPEIIVLSTVGLLSDSVCVLGALDPPASITHDPCGHKIPKGLTLFRPSPELPPKNCTDRPPSVLFRGKKKENFKEQLWAMKYVFPERRKDGVPESFSTSGLRSRGQVVSV